jgi:hypothetical protein
VAGLCIQAAAVHGQVGVFEAVWQGFVFELLLSIDMWGAVEAVWQGFVFELLLFMDMWGRLRPCGRALCLNCCCSWTGG